MRDLPRLIHEGADDFERSLLSSTARDVGSDRALSRTLAAVGLAGVVVTSSPSLAAAAAKTSSASLEVAAGKGLGTTGAAALMKWGAMGALGVALAGGAVMLATPTQKQGTVTEMKLVTSNDATPNAATPAPSPATDVIPVEDLAAAPEDANEAPRSGAQSSRKKGTTSLTDEIEAVGEIRSMSQPTAALQAISRYQQRFPRGRLQQEVTVLKIQALERSGQHAQALKLGNRFLAAHPTSAHAKRIRSVLGIQARP